MAEIKIIKVVLVFLKFCGHCQTKLSSKPGLLNQWSIWTPRESVSVNLGGPRKGNEFFIRTEKNINVFQIIMYSQESSCYLY